MTHWPALRRNVARLRHRDRGDLTAQSNDTSELVIDEFVVAPGMGITTAAIAEGTEVHVQGSVKVGNSNIEFHGTIEGTWSAECRRCVEPVSGAVSSVVHAIFVDDPEMLPDEADTYEIVEDFIDLGDVVYEELMLALPLSPLCADDCVGADPERFAPTAEPIGVECAPARDPRWLALDALSFDEDVDGADNL